MSHVYSADEIFDMAEQIERNGAKFYRDAAESVSDAETKDFLLMLAKMEDNHLRTFSNMRAELSGREMESPTFDPNNEAALYLKSLADSKIFTVPITLVSKVSTGVITAVCTIGCAPMWNIYSISYFEITS